MKKVPMMICLALAAVAFSSCNSKDSQPWVMTFGSLEADGANVKLIDPQGMTLVRDASSSVQFPSFSDLSELGLDRARIFFQYQGIEGMEYASPKPIALHSYQLWPTYLPEEVGSLTSDDPLLAFTSFMYPDSPGMTPAIHTSANYLDLGFMTIGYMDNKGDDDYALQEFAVEIDRALIPAASGSDTINMHLRLFSNRDADEAIEDRGPLVIYQPSIDLQDVPVDFGFPTRDGGQNNLTYVIKLNYKAYESWEYPSDEAVVDRFVTTTWTPNNPYPLTDPML